jgi:hypothetical protein
MPLTDKQWSAAGGSAFPCDGGVDSNLYPDPGMTLRDYFAAKAVTGIMAGLMASSNDGHWHGWKPAAIASEAYLIADAMLKAREA